MKTITFLFLSLTVILGSYAQVGINTVNPNPNSALDINGKLIIRDLSAEPITNINDVQLMLTSTDGTVSSVDVSADISINNDELVVGTGRYYGIKAINLGNANENALANLDLGLEDENKGKVVFMLDNNQDIKLTGIKGGTEGRRIIIINNSGNKKLEIKNEDNSSTSLNRIKNFSKDSKTNKGSGSIELVYTTEISGGRWIAYSFDEGQDND
jgi:hypothetical protein